MTALVQVKNNSDGEVKLETGDLNSRLVKLNSSPTQLNLLIKFCKGDFRYEDDIIGMKKQLREFRNRVFGPGNGEFIVYEFLLSEVIIFCEEWSRNSVREMSYIYTKKTLSIFTNFILQIILNLHEIWQIPRKYLEGITKITITPWFQPDSEIETLSGDSMLLFIYLEHKDPKNNFLTGNNLGFSYFSDKDIGNYENVTKLLGELKPSNLLKTYVELLNYSLHQNWMKTYKHSSDIGKKSSKVLIQLSSMLHILSSVKNMRSKSRFEEKLSKKNQIIRKASEREKKDKDDYKTRESDKNNNNRIIKNKDKDTLDPLSFSRQRSLTSDNSSPIKSLYSAAFEINKPRSSVQESNLNNSLHNYSKIDLTNPMLNFIKTNQIKSPLEIEHTEPSKDIVENFLSEYANKDLHINIDKDIALRKNEKKLDPNTNSVKVLKEVKSKASEYDKYFYEFRRSINNIFEIENVVNACINKTADKKFLPMFSAENVAAENLDDWLKSPKSIASSVTQAHNLLKKIYLEQLPTIYKIKILGQEKEEELFIHTRSKKDEVGWTFKRKILLEGYKIRIVNFKGKVNLLLEQFFECITTNPKILSSILISTEDLPMYNKLCRIIYTLVIPKLPELRQGFLLNIMHQTINGFLDFLFDDYLIYTKNFYIKNNMSSTEFTRLMRIKHPDAHRFLNLFRWALDVPELSKLKLEAVQKLSSLLVSNFPEMEFFKSRYTSSRSDVCRKLKFDFDILLLAEVEEIFQWGFMFQQLEGCSYLSVVMKELLVRVKSYTSKKQKSNKKKFSQNTNLFIFSHFFIIYCIVSPFIARLCRNLVEDHELLSEYMFLSPDWLNSTYEVSYLESSESNIAVYFQVVDLLHSILPSLLKSVYQSNDGISDEMTLTLVERAGAILYNFEGGSLTARHNEPVPDSIFLDRVYLFPAQDFEDFVSWVKKWGRKKIDRKKSLLKLKLITSLELILEDMEKFEEEIFRVVSPVKELENYEKASTFVLVTSNLDSFIPKERFKNFSDEFLNFVYIKKRYIERYEESLEKFSVYFSQAFDQMEEENDYRSLPVVVSDERIPFYFLIKNFQLDELKEKILKKMNKNVALYFLWRKVDKQVFQKSFSGHLEEFKTNTAEIVENIPMLKVYKNLSECIEEDLLNLLKTKMALDEDIDFALNYYLRGLYY